MAMKIQDDLQINGYGVVEVRDADTGGIIYTERYTNVITDLTRARIMARFKGNNGTLTITHVAIGTSATTPTAADTALGAEVLRAVPTSVIDYSATEIGWRLFVSASMGNGSTLREIGLFNGASGGDMFARSTSFTPIVKNSSITVTFTHILRYA
jgi:hypothetical protein